MAINDKVASPSDISSAFVMQDQLAKNGLIYNGAFRMNEAMAVRILGVSLRHAGHEVSDDEIGERVIAEGAGGVIYDAISVITGLVAGPKTEEPEEGDPEKKAKPQSGPKS
ncbi:hypothetical protein [Dinoroseobacter sp. S124A]|uniref:hypothetical protein n=1 Tax=Dinoroseobacter sp. S124A TaxID=3415128 RepID=UPI003C79D260